MIFCAVDRDNIGIKTSDVHHMIIEFRRENIYPLFIQNQVSSAKHLKKKV